MVTPDRQARRADLAFSVVTIALGAFAWSEARLLPPSRFDPLGPGAFPRAISALLVLLGAIALLRVLRGRGLGDAETSLILGVGMTDSAHAPRPWLGLAAIGAVFVYALVLQVTPIGFFWATAAFITGLGLLLGRVTPRSLAIAVAVGFGASGALTLLFGHGLRLLLP